MIKCKVCNKDKNYNQYFATGRSMNAVCKTCLSQASKDRKNND